MIIAITGTPGCGKTTLAGKLAKKLDYSVLDVNTFLKSHEELIQSYDEERETKIIDEKKLARAITKYIDTEGITDLIIDSHLSHYLSKKVIDICIVLSCELPELKKRMLARGYNDLKIKENLEAETFDTILEEARTLGHNVVAIDSTKRYDLKQILAQLQNS